MRRLRLATALLCVGCGGPRVARLYDGPTRPADAVARVRDTSRVVTHSVDGKAVLYWGGPVVELLPGRHTLGVRHTGQAATAVAYLLRFDAAAGLSYLIDAETLPDGHAWRPRITDLATGREVPYEAVRP